MASSTLNISVQVGDRSAVVRITNSDRLVFPPSSCHPRGVTKGELASYIHQVAPAMLRHIGGRPMTLERWPKGLDGESFYTKNPPRGFPRHARTVVCTYPSGRSHPQLVIDDEQTLVWCVQMGTITFHPWAVRADRPHCPEELRFDLDAAGDATYRDVVESARLVRTVLAEAGLHARVKTSGRTGLHVLAPIVPERDFIDVRFAVIAAAREAARREPGLVGLQWWREERRAVVFLDYNQAARDRTLAAAFSPRSLPEGTVSVPVAWSDLESVHPQDCTIGSVPRSQAAHGDPWSGIPSSGRIERLLDWFYRDVENGLGDLPYPLDFPKMPGEPRRVRPSRRANP